VRRIFQTAPNPPRFPMYVRQAKQFMRAVDPTFDERKFGFGSLQDLLRACQREGLFRIERDRQGVIRLFPGNVMQPIGTPSESEEEGRRDVMETPASESAQVWDTDESAAQTDASAEPMGDRVDMGARPDADVVDGDVVQEIDVRPVVDGEEAPQEPAADVPKRGRGSRRRPATQPRAAKKTEGTAPRARKASTRPRSPRSRKAPAD
jgi:hypothetical protein